eukprot:1333328-Prymnesium_polylepis.1
MGVILLLGRRLVRARVVAATRAEILRRGALEALLAPLRDGIPLTKDTVIVAGGAILERLAGARGASVPEVGAMNV